MNNLRLGILIFLIVITGNIIYNNIKYKCIEGNCIMTNKGEYSSKKECKSACNTKAAKKVRFSDENIVENSNNVITDTSDTMLNKLLNNITYWKKV